MLQVFSVYDIKAKAFSKPVFETHTAGAIRSFTAEINNGQRGNVLREFPEDFKFFSLGTFDPNSGEFQANHKDLGFAKDYVREVQTQ